MQAFPSTFKKRWVLSFIGLGALSLLVWFLGPFVGFAGREPLTSEISRLLLIVSLFLIWGVSRLFSSLLTKRTNAQMVKAMMNSAQGDPSSTSALSHEEIATLERRFQAALEFLKNAKLGGRQHQQYLYQLPWYLMIGPSGSGKTTAIVHSGLQFPLAGRSENPEISGVGGTRNCDWFFTDEAVLLDTAGRYALQDSHPEVDRASWQGFLSLLRKYRRRRPINGVLLAISLADLMQQSEQARTEQAETIRQRIQELYQQLGISFPIYVLFTKCDLVAGFVEFFEDLGPEQRRQLWGITFPATRSGDSSLDFQHYSRGFASLEQRLNVRLTKRLQEERHLRKRALIYGFPQQFATLSTVTEEFLWHVFHSALGEQTPLLRGAYFTSGTQQGSPFDRLIGTLANTFGIDQQAITSLSGKGRSYFITELLRGVIFPEAELAGTDLHLERKLAWLHRGVYVGIVALTGFLVAALTVSFVRNQGHLQSIRDQTEEARRLFEDLPPGNDALLATLPVLDTVQDLSTNYGEHPPLMQRVASLGLYQGDKLGSEARRTYERLLLDLFLPRLVAYLEEQLSQAQSGTDYLYDALRVYLSLNDAERFDADTIEQYFLTAWEHSLPNSVTPSQRMRLKTNLQALVREHRPPLPVRLDTTLVKRVQKKLVRMPLAEQAYASLRQRSLAQRLSEFRLNEAAGPDAPMVFARESGTLLTKGIPGLYTYRGYHGFFLEETERIVEDLAGDAWVVGEFATASGDHFDKRRLAEEIHRTYLADYANHWQALLGDIRILSFSSLQQGVEMLNILTAQESPLRRLLEAFEHETTLARLPPPATPTVDGNPTTLIQTAQGLSGAVRSETHSLVIAPDTMVDRHFEAINAQVRPQGDSPPPLEAMVAKLEDLHAYLRSIASAMDRGNVALSAAKDQAGNVVDDLRRTASRAPPPLSAWLESIARDSTVLISYGATGHLNSSWASKILPFCQTAINGRYPLDPSSQREIKLEDFSRFFGPGGQMDQFFQEFLQPFVDTATRPWQVRRSGNVRVRISEDGLAAFQHAAAIKQAFFASGDQTPFIQFDLEPVEMDASATNFSLDLEGQRVTYNHGPIRPMTLHWPVPEGPHQVRISFSPAEPGGQSSIVESGTWAWFRILDKSDIRPIAPPDRFTVTFEVDGRTALFELRPSSAFNPFTLDALDHFWCPDKL